MNQTQIKYAVGRVSEIEAAKVVALRERHTAPGKSLTSKERRDLILSGKVKLCADCKRIETYDDVVKVFDFSKFEYPAVLNKKAFDAAVAKLRTAAAKVCDELMLGDAEEAKKLLAEFERSA